MDWLRSFFSGGFAATFSVPEPLSVAADVLTVSFAIFMIMSWIRQTRAWTLFRGFLVVVAIYLVALQFNMITVQWIMRATFNIGLITVVILFQPELRKALEQLGKGRFYKTFATSERDSLAERTINEITDAITEMSRNRTGALIVIEREVPLGDHERTGVSLDAVVSGRLLLNIFEDKAPLHDGAVIIRNNRISAASCILPLSPNEIGPDLGTRHRAAVGMSEVSDALVLVVSEETGVISAAQNGALRRGLGEADIRVLFANGGAFERKMSIRINRRKKSK